MLVAFPARADFRVRPYLQNLTPTSVEVIWFSDGAGAGELRCDRRRWKSQPEPMPTLAYPEWEQQTFFEGAAPTFPYRHRLTLTRLKPGRRYPFSVTQGQETFQGHLRTAPEGRTGVRFVAFADSETEPESSGNRVAWPQLHGQEKRLYLVDQTVGYQANLQVIKKRRPDFLVIAGDLVESGGEQRDWDEFWLHADRDLAEIPIIAAPGNHEYYNGPHQGRYQQPYSEQAIARFDSYFPQARYRAHYWGPVCVLVLDLCNGLPHQSDADTNFYLENRRDFNPGSVQYRWLEQQLKEASRRAAFTFVTFHHCPYSSGVHGLAPGQQRGQDPQSGVPTRALMPLFKKYRVAALLTGHDEMFERSLVDGIHVYDLGIAGDGLRGPKTDNPQRKFLAHLDSPEVWRDGVLQDGGKHYGHLEIEVEPHREGWRAVLTPVYVFPVCDARGQVVRFERRVYPDVVELSR